MISIQRNKRPPAPVELTPLIDVVFQLLVFFLLTSTFIQPAINVDLPETETADTDDDYTGVNVSLDEDGRIFIGDQEVAIENLSFAIRRELDARPDASVALRGDSRVDYGIFMKVLDVCREEGLEDVILLVEEAD